MVNSLSQLECFLDQTLGEELSLYIEEDSLSTSLINCGEQWTLEVITKTPEVPFLKRKMAEFCDRKKLSSPLTITSRVLPPKDWVQAVYDGFSPFSLGRFYIYGSHSEDTPPLDLFPLKIDAATAFGSGHHESTAGCLKALSLLSENQTFKAPLDMGCGSGILALAMARLWGELVLACDNDPEAVRVTHYNAQLNELGSQIKACVSEGFHSILGKSFDLITANILATPLCEMAGDALKALSPKGMIILSGILQSQAKTVIDSYESKGAKLCHHLSIGEWSTLVMQKEFYG